jgi:hypothetical protein
MKRTRSKSSVIQSAVEIKFWIDRTPTVDEVRPAACVQCEAASRPLGARLQVIGHGVRQRQVLGPLQPGQPPSAVTLLVRRFLCLVCGAVMTVLPQGVLGSRLYCVGAIVMALALWAIHSLSSAEVRARVSPWNKVADPRQWAMPARWVRAVRQARLFVGELRPSPASWSHRQVAERIVTSLVGGGHPAAAMLKSEFAGAR